MIAIDLSKQQVRDADQKNNNNKERKKEKEKKKKKHENLIFLQMKLEK